MSPGSRTTTGGTSLWRPAAAALARETVAALAAHPWSGNVREPQNVLATSPSPDRATTPSVPTPCRPPSANGRRRAVADAGRGREDLEPEIVRDALGRRGSVARAAGELGVTRQGLSKLMARLQIDRSGPRPSGGTFPVGPA